MKIIYGRPIQLMKTLDASNPPSPDAAKELLAQVSDLLNVDPDDVNGIALALNALIEAASAGDGEPGGDSDGSNREPGGGADGAAGVGIKGAKNPASIPTCDAKHGPAKRR